MIEEDYPAGTKVLVYNGEDADGNIQTFPRTLYRTTHLMPPNYYLGRRIQAIDLSGIHDNETRERIENKRAAAWQERAAAARPYDNNNPVPARMNDNDIPLGRVFVPAGGRKLRGGAPWMWRKLFQDKQRAIEKTHIARSAREHTDAIDELDRATNALSREERNMTARGEPIPDERTIRLDLGGGKSRRGRKSKKSRKRRSMKRRSRKTSRRRR